MIKYDPLTKLISSLVMISRRPGPATLRIIKIPSDPDSTEQGSSCLSFVVIRSQCLLGVGANQWAECWCVLCSTTAALKWCFNNTYFDRIMTFLWRHQMGTNTSHNDAKSDATQLAPLSSLHSDHILKTAIKHHSGAPGSILKILCILKLPNKKEKFVFIIQNSFQLSRRDCEVFNKQNSAAAWGREEYHHSATFL